MSSGSIRSFAARVAGKNHLESLPLTVAMVASLLLVGCSDGGGANDMSGPDAVPSPIPDVADPEAPDPDPPTPDVSNPEAPVPETPITDGPQPDAGGPPRHGRYIGTVERKGVGYFADALLTVDGELRLFLGAAPYSPSGVLELGRSDSSAQLVASVEVDSGHVSGSGSLIGQGCGTKPAAEFCQTTANIEISAKVGSNGFFGDLRVAADNSSERWALSLGRWENYYDVPWITSDLGMQYVESLAEFAMAGDTVVSIDRSGTLFLQSPHSGCVGNGALMPHRDGAHGVLVVILTLANCEPPYAHLNSEFAGLAAASPTNYWGYDYLLRIWLSTPDGTSPPAAIMMSGG